jgi:type I restriction enzyme, S subunit
MSKEKKNIPELRFPEFQKDGEWEDKTVGQVYDFKVTNSFSREYLNYEKGKVKNIHYGDIHTKFNTLFDITKEEVPFINLDVSIEKIKKESYCVEGDIILADASEDLNDVGKSIEIVNLNNEKLVSGLHTLLGRQRESKFTIGFGGYLFKSDWVRKQIQREAQGAKVLGISTSRIANVNISYPKKTQEQQKIASCLSSLDELIAAHNDKLQALKNHKKGLMQNLFPHPSASSGSGTVAEPVEAKVPKYRFPEFKDDGEWVESSLGDVATFLKGKGISKSDITENGNLPCIRYGELYTHYNEKISEVKSYTNLNAEDLVLSKANDVIIPASGETQIDIATAACVLENGIALGSDLNIIRTKINGVFLSYYLNNAKKMEIAQIAQGISVIHLYSTQLKSLRINIPNPKEQQKIASCLSALDELITAQAEKIEQLQQHKKGLMQGVFPKIV